MQAKATALPLHKKPAVVSITGMAFLIPAFAFLIYANYVPFVWNLLLSFQSWDGYLNQKWIAFANYLRLFQDELFVTSIVNSVFLAVSATIGSVLIGVVSAGFLYKVGKREGAVYRLILFMPSMMPIAVIALLFTFIYNPEMGMLNNFLKAIGLGQFANAWLEDRNTIMWCVSIVNVWRMAGLTMMLCFSSMLMLNESLFESSKLDGATYRIQFFKIVLPLIKPIIQLSTVYTLTVNFKTYDTVFIMTRGGPGNISMTVPIYMVDTAFTFAEFGYAATMGVAITVVIIACIALVNRALGGDHYEY